MTDHHSDLSRRVLARCDSDKLPADHRLRVLAAQFDRAIESNNANSTTATLNCMLSWWARLRSAWCKYSGEPLL